MCCAALTEAINSIARPLSGALCMNEQPVDICGQDAELVGSPLACPSRFLFLLPGSAFSVLVLHWCECLYRYTLPSTTCWWACCQGVLDGFSPAAESTTGPATPTAAAQPTAALRRKLTSTTHGQSFQPFWSGDYGRGQCRTARTKVGGCSREQRVSVNRAWFCEGMTHRPARPPGKAGVALVLTSIRTKNSPERFRRCSFTAIEAILFWQSHA